MRFQTLRSRGGAGEGPSRDRGCCCLETQAEGREHLRLPPRCAPTAPPLPTSHWSCAGWGGGAKPTTHTSHTHTTSLQGSAHPGQPSLGGFSAWRYPGCRPPSTPGLGQVLRLNFLLALVWPSHPERKASSSCLSA